MFKRKYILPGIFLAICLLLLDFFNENTRDVWTILPYAILPFFYAFLSWLLHSEPYQWKKNKK